MSYHKDNLWYFFVVKEKYKKTMQNVYTTSVTESTKDKAPFVYKSLEEIKEHITPTVEVTKVIKPIYNFKAS